MSDETKLTPADEMPREDARAGTQEAAQEPTHETVQEAVRALPEGAVPASAETVGADAPSPEDMLSSAATLPDVTLVNHMSVVDAHHVETCDYAPVRAALALTLSDEALRLFHEFCREVLRRPPTLGELRLLDRLVRVPHLGAVGHRHAVREMTTDSPEVSETWADMMEKHRFLSSAEGILPPPTLADALSLTMRYIHRTGRRQAFPPRPRKGQAPIPERLVVLTPAEEMEAAAKGYTSVARVRLSDGSEATVVRRQGGGLLETAPRKGDVILCARRVPSAVLSGFVAAQCRLSKPDVGALRVVTRHSLLETAVNLAGGLDLYAYLFGDTSGGKLPVDALCAVPTVSEPCADVLLYASGSHMAMVQGNLKRLGVDTIPVGVVRKDAMVSLCLRHPKTGAPVSVATLGTDLMRRMQTVAAHACTLSHTADAETAASRVRVPSAARLPSVLPSESGIARDGHEWVALCVNPEPVLCVREERMCLSSAVLSVDAVGEGYAAAKHAVNTATAALRERLASAADAGEVSLSVFLRGRAEAYEPLVEGLCGLYRAAAEQGLPMVSDLVLEESAPAALTLVVVAWAEAMPTPIVDDRQWSRFATQGAAQNAAQGGAGHPSNGAGHPSLFLFPILRRPADGGLAALGQAVNRRALSKCALQPLIPERVEERIPIDPPAEPAVPPLSASPAESLAAVPAETPVEEAAVPSPPPPLYRIEMRERIQPVSAAQLVAALSKPVIPVFAMSEAEAQFILAQASIRDALDTRLARGGTILVLGEACRAFASCGYLPTKLSVTSTVSAEGTAAVTYHGIMERAPATVRLLRAPLLLPVDHNAPHLLDMTLPDGTIVPDGFTGSGGRVLGLLNGVDVQVERILRLRRFTPDPPAEPTPAPTPTAEASNIPDTPTLI